MRPRSSTSTSDGAARRYLAILGIAVALFAALVAVFVFLLDPFQVFRRSSGVPDFYRAAQFQIPGIARHYPYDAVVLGTSTSSNFRPGYLAESFGWRAMNFTIAGSSIREQRAVLDTALTSATLRHVWWGIDPFAFTSDDGRSFPYYLYGTPGWHTAPYLFNLGAATHGLSMLARPVARRTSLLEWTEKASWDREYTYGRAQVLNAWTHREAPVAVGLPGTPDSVERAVRVVAGVVRSNPGVEFRIVLIPASILYSKLLLENRPAEFEAGCAIAAAILRDVTGLPNARVHDFRDAREITHDLDAFKDLVHFSGEISLRLVRDVAAGRHAAGAAGADDVWYGIRADASAYVPPVR